VGSCISRRSEAKRDDAAGVAAFTWTARGELESIEDPITGVTSYDRDAASQPTTITSAPALPGRVWRLSRSDFDPAPAPRSDARVSVKCPSEAEKGREMTLGGGSPLSDQFKPSSAHQRDLLGSVRPRGGHGGAARGA
jgi:YD repeat-containing protein